MSPNTSNADEDQAKVIGLLSERAKGLLEVQSSIFDQTRQNSAAILTVLAVFLPFFLNGLNDAFDWIKYAALVPTALILVSMLMFLLIFRTQEFDRGIGLHKFQDLIGQSYQAVMLYDLGANISSYKDNKVIVSDMRKRYSLALLLTYLAIVTSAFILVINQFVKPADKVTQVHITNPPPMSNTPPAAPQIPVVPTRERERIEKGEPGRPFFPPTPSLPQRPSKPSK